LKGGSTIAEEFLAPQTIWNVEEASRGYNTVDLTIYHDEASELQLDSSYYELYSLYESIDENVSR
jgi:hypothetical protein